MFLGNINGVTKVSSFIVPILIFCIAFLSILNITNLDINSIGANLSKVENGWFMQSIIYCSYNMILVTPVLVSLRDYLKSKKQIIGISILSSSIILVLAISIYLLLTRVNVDFNTLEMPAVYIISNYFPKFSYIYGIVILTSIFSTAISIGVSFLENISKNKTSYTQFATLMCISSILVSNVGFSNLVKILFPMFGYLGLVQIYFILRC